ncbi:hypothetical protein OC846_001169 [Tilletia horrida]|uniref:Uncharacterized protein n=1 Tax=Tilletia horrida TaxID=155126 RepID=A0AAN6JW87_9BASI|nr:hypothetical protein OC846_001169 [Tilletia horrida]KAK0569402.1 hypothetical protein OC861_001008 [Tilletia horrida]
MTSSSHSRDSHTAAQSDAFDRGAVAGEIGSVEPNVAAIAPTAGTATAAMLPSAFQPQGTGNVSRGNEAEEIGGTPSEQATGSAAHSEQTECPLLADTKAASEEVIARSYEGPDGPLPPATRP